MTDRANPVAPTTLRVVDVMGGRSQKLYLFLAFYDILRRVMVIEKIIRWLLCLVAISIATFFVDVLLLKWVWVIHSDFFVLLWYMALLLAPMLVQFFIIKAFIPYNKKIIFGMAFITAIITQIIIYRFFIADVIAYS